MAVSIKATTPSMQAHASVLLSRAHKWARGFDNKRGVPIYLFASSRTDKDGNPIYHRTHHAGDGCTCPSYLYRGICSHALAAQQRAEQLADIDGEVEIAFMELALSKRGNSAGAALIKTYEQIWQED
jgi:hypothetical protein